METGVTEMQEENIFGKIRGRFDVQRAQQAVRDLPDIALSNCAAMKDEQLREFAKAFNRVFDRKNGAARFRLIEVKNEG
jgi:hypothetical protein